MSGNIVPYQGGLAYQDGDRVVPMQRQDLAEKFLQIMQGVEDGLISQQHQAQAFQLMLQEERKAQAEALAIVTRFADTAILSANQSTAISQDSFKEVVGIAHGLIEASKEKDRAIAATSKASSQEVVYVIDMPLWKTIEPFAYFCLLIVGLTGLIALFTVNRQISQPSIPQSVIQRSL